MLISKVTLLWSFLSKMLNRLKTGFINGISWPHSRSCHESKSEIINLTGFCRAFKFLHRKIEIADLPGGDRNPSIFLIA